MCCKESADLVKLGKAEQRGSTIAERNPFTWRRFQVDIMLLCVRWYLRSAVSYRDLEEMTQECGLSVELTTIYRWVQHSAPELERRCCPHLKFTLDSWRVDETYIKTISRLALLRYPHLFCHFIAVKSFQQTMSMMHIMSNIVYKECIDDFFTSPVFIFSYPTHS